MCLERRLGYETEGRRLHARVQNPPSANFFGLVWSDLLAIAFLISDYLKAEDEHLPSTQATYG